MNDFDQFERRLAAALRSDADQSVARFEPQRVARAAVAKAHGSAARMPRRFSTPTMFTRLAAAAVIGALVVGGAFYLGHRGQPAVVGGPSQTSGASASPSETASPSASPSPSVVGPRAASWTPTGSMVTPRSGHTATLLHDGKVLVAGGYNGSQPLASAELYDPASGTWTATGSMAFARGGHTATLLRNGKVLVAGCAVGPGGAVVGSAELYDPASGTWTATGDTVEARCLDPTATLLSDGRVLVAGGRVIVAGGRVNIVASAELYDPSTGTWSATGSMTSPRYEHSATLLPDGTVLVAGGVDHPGGWGPELATAELYNPATGTWTATGSLSAPHLGTATLLSNGKVLVLDSSAELYDPGGRTWTTTGSPVTTWAVRATLLPDGRVLLTGLFGTISQPDRTSAELYDPSSGTWTVAGGKSTPRYRNGFTATLLPDGRVLVAGGFSDPQCPAGCWLASAELYDPGSP